MRAARSHCFYRCNFKRLSFWDTLPQTVRYHWSGNVPDAGEG